MISNTPSGSLVERSPPSQQVSNLGQRASEQSRSEFKLAIQVREKDGGLPQVQDETGGGIT